VSKDRIAGLSWKKRPRSIKAEMKRQVAQAEMIHLSTVRRLLEMLGAAVRRHVKDPATLQALNEDLRRFAGAGDFSATPEGEEEEEGHVM
jgi:hypothetical protein